jgi:transposase-like protein
METETITSKKAPPHPRFSLAFKKQAVAEYERGFLNKNQLQEKYVLGGNSTVLKWCRKYVSS